MDKFSSSLGQEKRGYKNLCGIKETKLCMPTRSIPNTFTDKVLESIGRQEAYSFTDGFSGYHQIRIA
jgi:hypothetical protein